MYKRGCFSTYIFSYRAVISVLMSHAKPADVYEKKIARLLLGMVQYYLIV